ncbi:MAG: hypothetical protein WBQ49_05955 [Rhodomicrobium sp.]
MKLLIGMVQLLFLLLDLELIGVELGCVLRALLSVGRSLGFQLLSLALLFLELLLLSMLLLSLVRMLLLLLNLVRVRLGFIVVVLLLFLLLLVFFFFLLGRLRKDDRRFGGAR